MKDNIIYFSRMECAVYDYLTLHMRLDDADILASPGNHTNDAKEIVKKPYIQAQFRNLDPNAIRLHLKNFGAWDSEQLKDDYENQLRLVWTAGCDIIERKVEDYAS